TSAGGIEAATTETDNGQAVTLCIDDDCTDVTSETKSRAAEDTPLGWVDGGLVYVRDASGAIIYHVIMPTDSGEVDSDTPIYDDGWALRATTPVYVGEGRLWVITEGSGWLVFTNDNAVLYGAPDPELLRFVDTDNGPFVGYISGGNLTLAPQDAPG